MLFSEVTDSNIFMCWEIICCLLPSLLSLLKLCWNQQQLLLFCLQIIYNTISALFEELSKNSTHELATGTLSVSNGEAVILVETLVAVVAPIFSVGVVPLVDVLITVVAKVLVDSVVRGVDKLP